MEIEKGKAMTDNMHDIYFDTILLDLKAKNTTQVYQRISKHVSSLIGTPEKFLLDVIIDNEETQNSGVENGVSIIHARLPRLTRPIIVFSTIENPIDFKAADGKFVDMAVLVLSPEFEGTKHLQRLAMVTRFFNNKETRMTLRSAQNIDNVRSVIKEVNLLKKVA